MITDEQLVEFSIDVDNFILDKAVKYSIGALELSAIINARLLLLNQVAQGEEDFKSLLIAIASSHLKPEKHMVQ
jgi:hypothetical protein